MIFQTLEVSQSGLVAQRERLNSIAANVANLNTTRNEQGEVTPFQRRLVTFMADASPAASAGPSTGTKVKFAVHVDAQAQPREVYDPGHPDADEQGIVRYPGISLTKEFVNALDASRAYEANLSVLEMTKAMFQESLRLLG